MAFTLHDYHSVWRFDWNLEGTLLSIHHPNDFPLQAIAPNFGGDVMHELVFWVVDVLIDETWNFWERRILTLVEDTK